MSGGWKREAVEPTLTECLLWAGPTMMGLTAQGRPDPPTTVQPRVVRAVMGKPRAVVGGPQRSLLTQGWRESGEEGAGGYPGCGHST